MSVTSSNEENFMAFFIPVHTPMDHKFTFKSRIQQYVIFGEMIED